MGLIVTDATGTVTAVTVTIALAVCPSLVARMVAVPAPVAVTSPVLETVATLAAVVVHETARPVSGLPAASRGVAVSCPV